MKPMNEKSRAASRKLLPLLLLLLAAATNASAQAEGNPPNWCRNGAFPSDSERFVLGWVKGRRGERAYFHKDADGCPSPRAQCRERAYVVPGNEVIVSRTFGDWACAWYQPARGPERVGWIEAHRLDISEAPSSPMPARFVGEWAHYENALSIRPGKGAGRLAVSGQAYWHGVGDNVHVGEVAGEVAPAGNALTLEDDTCRVTAHLVGPYLIVRDNKQCGGVNVTFDGVYRKKPPRRPRRD
jgi:hypothetical protein